MARLLGSCSSSRVLSELQSWTDGLADTFNFSPAAREPPSFAAPQEELPVVVIAGCRDMRQERLLRALCGAPELDGSHCEVVAEKSMHGVIETKYYSAKVKYLLLDLDGDNAPTPTAQTERVDAAEAVILLLDLSRPESFQAVKGLVPGPAEIYDDSFMDDSADRVQICIATNGGTSLSGKALDDAEDEVRLWCVQRGFELLCCALEDADLDALRKRSNDTREGRSVGLLEEDTEGSVTRLLEALECHSSWSSLQRKEAKASVATTPKPPRQESAEIPAVLFAGVTGAGHQELASAITAGQPARRTQVILETKYYQAQLLLIAADIDESVTAASALVQAASGLVLVCDAAKFDTLQAAQDMYDASQNVSKDDSAGCDRSATSCGVKLVVVADRGDGSSLDADQFSRISEWCADRGFELLCCKTTESDLKALAARWHSGGAGTPLLRSSAPEGCELIRLVEALECNAWPGMEAKKKSGAVPAAPSPEKGSGKQPGDADEVSAVAVENFEHLSQEIQKVREIEDDQKRKERACDIAMKLAASLGIDSDSD